MSPIPAIELGAKACHKVGPSVKKKQPTEWVTSAPDRGGFRTELCTAPTSSQAFHLTTMWLLCVPAGSPKHRLTNQPLLRSSLGGKYGSHSSGFSRRMFIATI